MEINGTDNHPKVPFVADDVLNVSFGITGTVNVLANDDFIGGLATSLTRMEAQQQVQFYLML
jgi:hypothetical protein